jgi:hypothetical protein
MDLGTAFTNGVNTVLPNIAQWFTNVFQTMGGIFMTGTGENAQLSVVGWILVIVVGVSVVGFGLRFIMSLIRRIRA